MNRYTVAFNKLDDLLETRYTQVFDARNTAENGEPPVYPDIYLTCTFRVEASGGHKVKVKTEMKLSKKSGRNYTSVLTYTFDFDKDIVSTRELPESYLFDVNTALEEFVGFTKRTKVVAEIAIESGESGGSVTMLKDAVDSSAFTVNKTTPTT